MIVPPKTDTAIGLFLPPPGRLVNAALSDASNFGDNDPLPRALTSVEAEEAKLRLVKRLRFYRLRVVYAWAIADILERCSSAGRCRLGCCPVCRRAFQRYIVKAAADQLFGSDSWQFTVLFDQGQGRVPKGALHSVSMSSAGSDLLTLLDETGLVAKVLGGIEVDLSDETQRNGQCVWQVHAHLMIETDHPDSVAQILRRAYPSPDIYRPVLVKQFDNSIKGISYLVKSHFRRKVFFWSIENEEWRNRKLRLAALDDIELAFWLTKSGLRSRLLLSGFKTRWRCIMT